MDDCGEKLAEKIVYQVTDIFFSVTIKLICVGKQISANSNKSQKQIYWSKLFYGAEQFHLATSHLLSKNSSTFKSYDSGSQSHTTMLDSAAI